MLSNKLANVTESRTRMASRTASVFTLVVVFGALIVPAAVMAACPGAPSDAIIPTECRETGCSGDYSDATNFVNIVPDLLKARCTASGQSCCVRLGDTACTAEATFNSSLSGRCESGSCDNTKTASTRGSGLSTCPSGDVCCLSKDKLAAGATCTKLPGVTSKCQQTTGADQINLLENTKLAEFVAPNSCNQSCVVTRGSGLCKAMADAGGVKGEFTCVKDGDCNDQGPLAWKVSGIGEVCPSGQLCCIAKPGATASAGQAISGSSVVLPDPLGGLNFPKLVGNIVKTFAGIAGSIALLMFVWGGIGWIMSGGNAEKVNKARSTLVNATIGLVLILAAYSFVSAIIDTLLAPSITSTTAQSTGGTTPTGQ